MNRPLKWKWILLMALGAWIPVAALYETGFTTWKDITLVHTLICPAIALVALIPFSYMKLANSRWLMPVAGIWAGVAFPGVYIGGCWMMGWVNHCGKLFAVGGIVLFLTLNTMGVVERWRERRPTSGRESISAEGAGVASTVAW